MKDSVEVKARGRCRRSKPRRNSGIVVVAATTMLTASPTVALAPLFQAPHTPPARDADRQLPRELRLRREPVKPGVPVDVERVGVRAAHGPARRARTDRRNPNRIIPMPNVTTTPMRPASAAG